VPPPTALVIVLLPGNIFTAYTSNQSLLLSKKSKFDSGGD
jgi:hypothetical protein